jgi:hypothetical protein
LAGSFLAAPTSANPLQIDRTLKKEPVYKTTPQYGLVIFSCEGKDRVWLVRDGDILYVDRNGSGDLTEPGKRVASERKPGTDPEAEGYTFEVGEVTVGGRTHKGVTVACVPLKLYANAELGKRPDVKAAMTKDPKAMLVSVSGDVEIVGIKGGGVGGRVSFTAGPLDLGGVLQFARSPAEAPIIRFSGPFEVTFFAERPSLRVGRGAECVLVVGTPGIGPGTFAMVGYEGTIPSSAKPVIEVLAPRARPSDPPFREKFEIKSRC